MKKRAWVWRKGGSSIREGLEKWKDYKCIIISKTKETSRHSYKQLPSFICQLFTFPNSANFYWNLREHAGRWSKEFTCESSGKPTQLLDTRGVFSTNFSVNHLSRQRTFPPGEQLTTLNILGGLSLHFFFSICWQQWRQSVSDSCYSSKFQIEFLYSSFISLQASFKKILVSIFMIHILLNIKYKIVKLTLYYC